MAAFASVQGSIGVAVEKRERPPAGKINVFYMLAGMDDPIPPTPLCPSDGHRTLRDHLRSAAAGQKNVWPSLSRRHFIKFYQMLEPD